MFACRLVNVTLTVFAPVMNVAEALTGPPPVVAPAGVTNVMVPADAAELVSPRARGDMTKYLPSFIPLLSRRRKPTRCDYACVAPHPCNPSASCTGENQLLNQ